MKIIRNSNLCEYYSWYLDREYKKRKKIIPNYSNSEIKAEIELHHKGKMWDNIDEYDWEIVLLDRKDCENLLFLDSGWVKKAKLLDESTIENSRLLKGVVNKCMDVKYFDNHNLKLTCLNEYQNRQKYLLNFRKQSPILIGNSRIVVRELFKSEKLLNPMGSYYLHDGNGRMLAYLYLVYFESMPWTAVEAFLAKAKNH